MILPVTSDWFKNDTFWPVQTPSRPRLAKRNEDVLDQRLQREII
jgi:hypothetical protein